MTVKQLYSIFEKRIPKDLSESWDNDGLMCAPDSDTEVKRVLLTLDVTEEVVDYAVSKNFDLIISHHPIIFRPIKSITEDSGVPRKLIKLITSGISVFSFHTRADRVDGGVNDILAELCGLENVERLGENGGLARIGNLDAESSLEDFAANIKIRLGAPMVLVSDAYNTVSRVAVCGGDGKDFIDAAIAAGADTFVSGRIGYNTMIAAEEMGINLIEASHFFTEQPVTRFYESICLLADPDIYTEVIDCNNIKIF